MENQQNIKEVILGRLSKSSAEILKSFLPMFSDDELSIKGNNFEVQIDGKKKIYSLCEEGVSNFSLEIGSSSMMHHMWS